MNAVRRVQTWYPQIYLACHIDHQRSRSAKTGISPRESSLLAHLDEQTGTSPAALARHLSIGAPTLSAALKRLARLGYVTQARHPEDARRLEVRLTPAGALAMSASSVLEASRVRALLRRLSADERARALDGLGLLARAARELSRQDEA